MALPFSPAAHADVVEVATMTFQSGAQFTGSVSFANDYSSITGVNGVLTGYQYGSDGYVGSGSDVIDAVLALNTNYSTGAPIYGNFLLDGPSDGSNAFNFIQFTYNYANAPNLIFADPSSGIFGTGKLILLKETWKLSGFDQLSLDGNRFLCRG